MRDCSFAWASSRPLVQTQFVAVQSGLKSIAAPFMQ